MVILQTQRLGITGIDIGGLMVGCKPMTQVVTKAAAKPLLAEKMNES